MASMAVVSGQRLSHPTEVKVYRCWPLASQQWWPQREIALKGTRAGDEGHVEAMWTRVHSMGTPRKTRLGGELSWVGEGYGMCIYFSWEAKTCQVVPYLF